MYFSSSPPQDADAVDCTLARKLDHRTPFRAIQYGKFLSLVLKESVTSRKVGLLHSVTVLQRFDLAIFSDFAQVELVSLGDRLTNFQTRQS
jgi:hypothetical protein